MLKKSKNGLHKQTSCITLKNFSQRKSNQPKRYYKDNMKNYTRIMDKTKQFKVLKKRLDAKRKKFSKKGKILYIISDNCFKSKKILRKILDFLDICSIINFFEYCGKYFKNEIKSCKIVKSKLNSLVAKVEIFLNFY